MVATELLDRTLRIYEEDPENDPFDDGDVPSIGYTAATIMELTRGCNIPAHVMRGLSKIDAFVPTLSKYETIALPVWGHHLLTDGDVAAKQAIAQSMTRCPTCSYSTIIGPSFKHTANAAQFVKWALYTHVKGEGP